jgi:hypothetical protein
MGTFEGNAEELPTSMIYRKYSSGQVINIASDDLKTDLDGLQ